MSPVTHARAGNHAARLRVLDSVQHHPAGSSEPIGPAGRGRGPCDGRSVDRRVRIVAVALLAAYLALVAWQSLRPLAVLWVPPANLEPLATIRADIEEGPQAAARTIGGGLLRLAPLGLLLPLLGCQLGGRRFASLFRAVFTGAMLALLIEWSQSMVPSRVADVDSIILNTTGVALTHLACYGRLRALTLDRRQPDGAVIRRGERSGVVDVAPRRRPGGGVTGREAAAGPSVGGESGGEHTGHDGRPGHPGPTGHAASPARAVMRDALWEDGGSAPAVAAQGDRTTPQRVWGAALSR